MSAMEKRAGEKYGGRHTTLIPAAAIICDIANACNAVSTISPGFITMGLRSVNGRRRVKIVDDGGGVLLSVRDNTSHQNVHVYTKDLQATKLAIARGARNAGIAINFGRRNEEARV